MGKHFARPKRCNYETEEEYLEALEDLEAAESDLEDYYRESEIIKQLESNEQSGLV